MSYGDSDYEPIADESTSAVILTALVRGLGLVLLLAGLLTAAFILMEAWALYKYPQRIEVIAVAVEKGSNIDKSLFSEKLGGDASAETTATGEREDSKNIRLSYFFAWFIAFFLILLIARIAMNAVSTGGQLALYDTEVKKLARALLDQTGRKPR